MLLDDYLLTDDQKNSIKQLEKFIRQNNNNPKIIIPYLKQLNLDNLIIGAEYSALIAQWCQHEDMDDYWLAIWRGMGRFPTREEADSQSQPYHELKSQLTISNFNLVRGMYFYDHGNYLYKCDNKNYFAILFYKHAATYHNFAALQALTKTYLKTPAVTELSELFEQLKKSAAIHGTPAFLLCALVCVGIAQACVLSKNTLAQHAAQQSALQYLYTAENCQLNSCDSIYNAYYGRGIAYSNSWHISEISELRKRLLQETNLEKDKESQTNAETQGKRLAQIYNDNIEQLTATTNSNFYTFR